MSKQRFISILEINPDERETILQYLIPIHDNLYLRHVTEAYNVGRHHPIPEATEVLVTGFVENSQFQAFLVTVNGKSTREDGKPYHITISTADGVPPSMSGSARAEDVIMLDEPFSIMVTPKLIPRTIMKPEKLAA